MSQESLNLGRFLISVALLAAAFPSGARAAEPTAPKDLMRGKVKTDRAIEFLVVVDGTSEEIFELWTTREGVSGFFGSDALIEARLGGLYEIRFGVRPDGEIAGPRGNRIVGFEPSQALDFEWEMPQFAKQLNTRPLPTWVEVRFEPFTEEPPRTQVRVAHHGFRRGEGWDDSYEFFERNWFDILFRLKLHCTYFAG